jgi:hypothetical protein
MLNVVSFAICMLLIKQTDKNKRSDMVLGCFSSSFTSQSKKEQEKEVEEEEEEGVSLLLSWCYVCEYKELSIVMNNIYFFFTSFDIKSILTEVSS